MDEGICKKIVDLPNLKASAPTPSSAIVGVAQTFTSLVSSENNPTGKDFMTLFQVKNGSGVISPISANTRRALVAGESGPVISDEYIFT